ncbi:MAG: type II toxin-antitoxin system RelE/ParE family toxin [Candidatus Methylophosphatis roskildensis]
MSPRRVVKLTANFERNLEEVQRFLEQADLPRAFDELLDELSDTVVPNLERFPSMGRLFLERPVRSVETGNGLTGLMTRLDALGQGAELREYVLSHYLLLYAVSETAIYLLSIRHHRQLSFDFESLWGR